MGFSGSSAGASALGSGPRGRWFKSTLPDFLCLRDLHEAFVLDGRVRVGVEGRSMTHEGGLGRTTAHQDASELLYLPSAFCFSKSSMASWNISSIWVVHASREYFFADWAYSCSICFL